MVQKVAVSREFEARLRHAATGKLSLSTQQKMGTFFELGKDKAAKRRRTAPMAIRLWETFTFYTILFKKGSCQLLAKVCARSTG